MGILQSPSASVSDAVAPDQVYPCHNLYWRPVAERRSLAIRKPRRGGQWRKAERSMGLQSSMVGPRVAAITLAIGVTLGLAGCSSDGEVGAADDDNPAAAAENQGSDSAPTDESDGDPERQSVSTLPVPDADPVATTDRAVEPGDSDRSDDEPAETSPPNTGSPSGNTSDGTQTPNTGAATPAASDETSPTQPPTTGGSTTATTSPTGEGDRFATLPPGSTLPDGADCAARVRPAPEVRSGNATANATRGEGSHDVYPRVDGDFTGTTDEILQWVACKWGIDEDIVRAQAAIESWWHMSTGGDKTSDQALCHPRLRTPADDCPESIGLLQVRYQYHGEAFENENAIRSSAYNVDYAYAVWRECYEGRVGWLNTVDRGREYEAGDVQGCLGAWFAGRWYTGGASDYIERLTDYLDRRVWEQSDFLNG